MGGPCILQIRGEISAIMINPEGGDYLSYIKSNFYYIISILKKKLMKCCSELINHIFLHRKNKLHPSKINSWIFLFQSINNMN